MILVVSLQVTLEKSEQAGCGVRFFRIDSRGSSHPQIEF